MGKFPLHVVRQIPLFHGENYWKIPIFNHFRSQIPLFLVKSRFFRKTSTFSLEKFPHFPESPGEILHVCQAQLQPRKPHAVRGEAGGLISWVISPRKNGDFWWCFSIKNWDPTVRNWLGNSIRSMGVFRSRFRTPKMGCFAKEKNM